MKLSKTLKGLVIFLFVLGGILLANGGMKISLSGADILNEVFVFPYVMVGLFSGEDVTKMTQTASDINEYRKVEFFVTHPLDHENGTIKGEIDIELIVRSHEAWSVDNKIFYNLTAKVSGTDKITEMYFVLSDPSDDLILELNKTDFYSFKEQQFYRGALLDTKNSNTNPHIFTDNGFFTIPIKSQVTLFGGYRTDSSAYPIPNSQPLIEIEPAAVKVQADASRALMEQIDETRITNDILEGLTWILISVIPIGFGFEIILREYYHNKRRPDNH